MRAVEEKVMTTKEYAVSRSKGGGEEDRESGRVRDTSDSEGSSIRLEGKGGR